MLEYIYRMTHCCVSRGANQIIKRCVLEDEQGGIIDNCHASPFGGHFVGDRKT